LSMAALSDSHRAKVKRFHEKRGVE
jgi:hypothetical protein